MSVLAQSLSLLEPRLLAEREPASLEGRRPIQSQRSSTSRHPRISLKESTEKGAEFSRVRRAQSGDVAAFESLYRLHSDRIYGLCLRMAGDRTRAEDLTQEAFVRAWQKLDSFRFGSQFGTWLHRLAVNVVLSELRKRDDETLDELPEPTVAARSTGLAIDLERAIQTLPTKARWVFVLHDVEGYKHAEIAEIAGIAVGTSKAQLHRARKILVSELRPEEAE